MPVKFNCKSCNHQIIAESIEPGEKIGCRNCGILNTVPSSDFKSVTCTKCQHVIDFEAVEIYRGTYKCPNCNYWHDYPPTDTTSNDKTTNVCPHCESSNDTDAIFCRRCGKRLIKKTFRTIRYCEKCESEFEEDDEYCKKDGSRLIIKKVEVPPNEPASEKTGTTSNSKGTTVENEETTHDSSEDDYSKNEYTNFITSLPQGRYGLANTFWVFGIAVSMLVQIALLFFKLKLVAFTILILLYQAYQIAVLLGVWRASKKYRGANIWGVLAQLSVLGGWVWWIINLGFLKMLSLEY